jgi:hypothetical protein
MNSSRNQRFTFPLLGRIACAISIARLTYVTEETTDGFRMHSSGLFPAVRSSNDNVSEHPVCTISIAYELRTPGNNPEESIRQSKHDESLKSRIDDLKISYMIIVRLDAFVILQAWEIPGWERL